MVWITLAAVALMLFIDWALAACTRHDRRQEYEDMDDGTHEVKFRDTDAEGNTDGNMG